MARKQSITTRTERIQQATTIARPLCGDEGSWRSPPLALRAQAFKEGHVARKKACNGLSLPK